MKKTIALATVAVLGISLTACSSADSQSGSAESNSQSTATDSSTDSSQSGISYGTAAFGETYTWDDGVSLSVSKPEEFSLSESVAEQYSTESMTAVQAEVTIKNDSDKDLEVGDLAFGVLSGGAYGQNVEDADANIVTPSGTLAAGEEATYTVGFLVSDPSDIEMYWVDMNGSREEVYFLG